MAAHAPEIESYHAHVYFDAETAAGARELRDDLAARFPVEVGRWHERPVGPHPMGSYQIAFRPDVFDEIVPYLMVHRRDCTVFLHPNTGKALEDHRDSPLWMGTQIPLKLEIFTKR